MLRLSLPQIEVWNPDKEEFQTYGGVDVELEHSLYTVSNWECKWKKPFADKNSLTKESFTDYIINFMCQTPDIPKSAWLTLNDNHIKQIKEYMDDKACATTVHHPDTGKPKTGRSEVVSAELIYFYLAQFGFTPASEYEHWHLNRLMTLIDVAAVKNAPPKKMGKREAAIQQRELNAQRRAKMGSRG